MTNTNNGNTLRVRKLYAGDIILTSTFNKYRPLLIIKVTDDFAYGVPLSTKKDELAFTNNGLNNCRFLDPKYKQWIHPMLHRVGIDWGVKNYMGSINPASLIKIRDNLKTILNSDIL